MGQDLDGLQGTWNIVSLEMDGQKVPGGGARIVVRGDRFTTIAMGAIYEGTVAVDRSCTPMTMDYLLADGRTQAGIWALEGKRLTTCFGMPGAARPSEFASIPGDGRTLTVWTPAGK